MAGMYFALMIGSIVWSIYYYRKFNEEYFESPVMIGPIILQGACLMVTIMNWPNPDIEVWFIVGLIATVASYTFGLTACWKRAKDLTKGNQIDSMLAVLTQALLPTGTVLLIVLLLVMIFGGNNKKSSNRRSGRR